MATSGDRDMAIDIDDSVSSPRAGEGQVSLYRS